MLNDKERKEIGRRRVPPGGMAKKRIGPGNPKTSFEDKWPADEITQVICLLEWLFVPERIDELQIYKTLCEGPGKLDWWWGIVLIGVNSA